jgi:hypothetical protein
MIVEYLFSSSDGDIPLDPDTLQRPLLLTPSEAHSSLTLGDYFGAVRQGLFELFNSPDPDLPVKGTPDRVIVRSEKVGALYHVASAQLFFGGRWVKLAVSAAFSEKGKACLNREHEVLGYLEKAFLLPFLPRIYRKSEVTLKGGHSFLLLLAEWLEDYHEWHLDSDQKICIWDAKRGNRTALERETFEIYKEASKILTLYYDTSTSRHIQDWHHAAGDFVVNTEGEKAQVRLTTVRGYEPSRLFQNGQFNPPIALVYFFLDLSMRMRLDRVQGTGEAAWAGEVCVEAVMRGFFEGLERRTGQSGHPVAEPDELLSLLKAFSEKELRKLFQPLLRLYREEGIQGLSMIRENLDHHAGVLHHAIQTFRG